MRAAFAFVSVLAAVAIFAAVPALAAPVEGSASAGDARAAQVPRTLYGFDALDFVSASRGWAVSLEANVRTTDGGATLTSFSLPGVLRYAPQAVDFVNRSVGYIVA